ncbi:MAG: hypothetical protein A2285_02580 [Elusimicrobia bacterium RIFOXYA12_FULL_57_11]|nr:MAG: hypothetical protein A2285_02580 [Elusimicrobia bacterium RIFOXYA12_FULL_57_11]
MPINTSPLSRLRTSHFHVLLLIECAALLILAEGFVAWRNLDMLLLKDLLYYQSGDLGAHRLSEDITLHYELKPGVVNTGKHKITINDFGFRGPRRKKAKPPGVTRIICLGSSNTYGAQVRDSQTYPARLEQLLNSRWPGKYEVWNAGVNAYVIPQTVAAAKTMIREYSPDLLLFQLNNVGRRPFLHGQPFQRYFDGDPELYLENLRFGWPKRLNFIRHWRLLRAVFFYINRLAAAADYTAYKTHNGLVMSDSALRVFSELYEENRQKIRMARLVVPGGSVVESAFSVLDIPVIRLADNLPKVHSPDFDNIHPPEYVYRWYASEIFTWLLRNKLLPADTAAR